MPADNGDAWVEVRGKKISAQQVSADILRKMKKTAEDYLGEAVTDAVITALEDYIIMPMENLKLAAELGLAPKRGVMLAGPPGTGKTTIGRALARRLRGKFFLIDGTVISGTEYFYHHVNSIFHMAMANAPAIVFIDDSDVIFESAGAGAARR